MQSWKSLNYKRNIKRKARNKGRIEKEISGEGVRIPKEQRKHIKMPLKARLSGEQEREK